MPRTDNIKFNLVYFIMNHCSSWFSTFLSHTKKKERKKNISASVGIALNFNFYSLNLFRRKNKYYEIETIKPK